MLKNTKKNCGGIATLIIKPNHSISCEQFLLDTEVPIYYGLHKTVFGDCLIGIYNDYICYLAFINTIENDPLIDLKQTWKCLNLVNNQVKTNHIVTVLNKLLINNVENINKIKLLLNGNNLQIKSWHELCNIGYGETNNYSNIAKKINCKAFRAVATAIANNHIAYFIPCHRVIKKTGAVGQYKWGGRLKYNLLNYELNNQVSR